MTGKRGDEINTGSLLTQFDRYPWLNACAGLAFAFLFGVFCLLVLCIPIFFVKGHVGKKIMGGSGLLLLIVATASVLSNSPACH